MLKKNQHSTTLRQLLQRFHDSVTLGDKELEKVHLYLFGSCPVPPFFRDNEIQETILYLKEIVETNNITCLEDLIAFYDNTARRMDDFLSLLVEQAEEDGELHLESFSLSFDSLTDHLGYSSFVDAFYDYLNNTPGKGSKRNILLEKISKYLNEAYEDYAKVDYIFCQQEAHRISSRIYLDQFAQNPDGECIYIMYSGNIVSKKIEVKNTNDLVAQAPIYSNKLPWPCRYMEHFLTNSMEPVYHNIISLIERERPIEDENIQIQLAQWLFYSKFTVPGVGLWLLGDIYWEIDSPYQISIDPLQPDEYLLEGLNSFIHNIYEKTLSSKRWVILKSPAGYSWLTSDNPGFSINLAAFIARDYEQVTDPFLKDIRPDTVEYYPLSKYYCLRIQPLSTVKKENFVGQNPVIEFEESTEQEVGIVNELTYCTQRDVVIASDKKILEQYEST